MPTRGRGRPVETTERPGPLPPTWSPSRPSANHLPHRRPMVHMDLHGQRPQPHTPDKLCLAAGGRQPSIALPSTRIKRLPSPRLRALPVSSFHPLAGREIGHPCARFARCLDAGHSSDRLFIGRPPLLALQPRRLAAAVSPMLIGETGVSGAGRLGSRYRLALGLVVTRWLSPSDWSTLVGWLLVVVSSCGECRQRVSFRCCGVDLSSVTVIR